MKKKIVCGMIFAISVASVLGCMLFGTGEAFLSASVKVSALTEVVYTDENGASQTADDYSVISSQTVWNSGVYLASGKTELRSTVTVSGNVVLILEDNCELTVIGGINVSSGNRLRIYSQSSGASAGKLISDASDTAFQAGIGSGRNGTDSGTIIISGGNIVSKGGNNASGIGGSANASGGTITINGGTITAVPGRYGAAVGGGYNGSGGRITVNGGSLTADSRYTSKGDENIDAAGIGGGFAGASGYIVINGGIITARAARTEFIVIKPDDIGNSAAANFWGLKAHVTINGGVINGSGFSYTVIIPEEITVGDELEIKAENVAVPNGRRLDVVFAAPSESGEFEIYSQAGDELVYIVKNNQGEVLSGGETVLSVSGGNTEGSSILYTSLKDTPCYSGLYSGRLTFTVSVI